MFFSPGHSRRRQPTFIMSAQQQQQQQQQDQASALLSPHHAPHMAALPVAPTALVPAPSWQQPTGSSSGTGDVAVSDLVASVGALPPLQQPSASTAAAPNAPATQAQAPPPPPLPQGVATRPTRRRPVFEGAMSSNGGGSSGAKVAEREAPPPGGLLPALSPPLAAAHAGGMQQGFAVPPLGRSHSPRIGGLAHGTAMQQDSTTRCVAPPPLHSRLLSAP